MPQLDFFSIANQFTWGIIYFVVFYFFVNNFVVPVIFASIFAREVVTKNATSDNFENVFYSFTTFYLFNSIISEISNDLNFANTEIRQLDFVTFVLFSKLAEFDINDSAFDPFESFDISDKL